MKRHLVLAIASFVLLMPAVLAGEADAFVPLDPAPPLESAPAPDGWRYEFRPFAWAISIEGDVGAGEFLAPVDSSFSDILDNLDFTVAASLFANKGRWGYYLEGLYLKTSPDLPSLPRGLLSIDGYTTETALVTGVIAYRALEWDGGLLDLLAGARYTYLATELRLSPGPGPGPISRTSSASKSFFDPIIALRVRQDLTERIYLNLAADIGGFGVSSDLIWDLIGGVGYEISDNFAVEFYYRYEHLDYDRGPILDVDIQGIFLGFAIGF